MVAEIFRKYERPHTVQEWKTVKLQEILEENNAASAEQGGPF